MSKQAKPRNVATLLNRAKLEYLSSTLFHTVLVARECVLRTVWNTIDDRYSSFALFSNVATFLSFALLRMEPHFLVLLVLTYSLATRTVWNTIDDNYSSFALLSNVATFLGFACFDIFSCH